MNLQTTANENPSRLDPDLVLKHVPLARRRVKAGQHIFRAGQPFHALHFVHVGFVKSTISSDDGREKVTGFHSRGELLGLESLGMTTHACDAIALDDGEVWEIQYADLLAACVRLPALQRGLAATLAAEIRVERGWMLTLGTLSAEQRVAALLLEFGARSQAMGYSGTHFVLRVTRAEIGSFLDLKVETVTRAITQLGERGLIDAQRREIRIKDAAKLRQLLAVPARTH
jgi:CRP/FNR family transcriptional regulator